MRTITIPRRTLILLVLFVVAILAAVVFATAGQSEATPQTTGPSVEQWEATLAAAPEERSLGGDVIALTGRATCNIDQDTATISVETVSGKEYTFTFTIGQVPIYRSGEFLAQPASTGPTVENPQAALEGLRNTPVVVVFRRTDPPQVGSILILESEEAR
jgi:hypothetical protein